MILELTVSNFEVKKSSFAMSAIDIHIKSENLDKSENQLEHIIDFLEEVYGRDLLKSYMRRTYDSDN